MTNLSPAAQAVLDAYWGAPTAWPPGRIAAAMRAAAEHIIGSTHDYERLMAIAAELEGASAE